MNFNAHSFAVSAYMTLMFTSAFLTLKVPGPLSFAGAAGGFEAAFTRISAKLELGGMNLPSAPEARFEAAAAGELKKVADQVEKGEETSKIPAKVASHFGLNAGTAIQAKSTTIGTAEPLDMRGVQVTTVNGSRVVVLTVYKGTRGTWYLTDEDGTIKKAASAVKGQPIQEVAVADAEKPFKDEKSFWLSHFGEVMVGKAGS